MQRLSWLCLLIALSACSPAKNGGTSSSSDGVGKLPPSKFAGVYLNKEEALSLRATGKISDKLCAEAREGGYTIGNAVIINDAGEARGYYPQWNTGETKVTFTVDLAGNVTYPAEKPEDRVPDDATVKATLVDGMLAIVARYQNETYPVQEFAVSSKDEVLKYFKYQEENCTKKKQ